jgi:hypothetical protein
MHPPVWELWTLGGADATPGNTGSEPGTSIQFEVFTRTGTPRISGSDTSIEGEVMPPVPGIILPPDPCFLCRILHLLNTGTSTLSDASIKYNVRKLAV